MGEGRPARRRLESILSLAAAVLAVLIQQPALAATYDIPADGSTVVGQVRVVVPSSDNTLLDIARHFDVGYHEITGANPGVDVWLPGHDAKVVVPARYILPPKPWKGIVINISQRRLFYFPAPAKGKPPTVLTYPISIAREGWSTPLGNTQVVAKHKDPSWFVPKSIRDEHIEEGESNFPEYFPPGPDNPMGMLAIQTGFSGIYIHGTNRPWGVGLRTSHGCLHLYPEDAAELFALMKRGIPVRVVDEPLVAGIANGEVVMSGYEPVGEYGPTNLFTRAVQALFPYLDAGAADPGRDVDWERVRVLVARGSVIPAAVGPGRPTVAEIVARLVPEPYAFPPYGIDANDASLPQR